MYLLDNFSMGLLSNFNSTSIYFEKVTMPELIAFFELNDCDELCSSIKDHEYDKIIREQFRDASIKVIQGRTFEPIIGKTSDPIVFLIAQYVGIRPISSYSRYPEDCPIQYWMLFQNCEQ